MANNMKKTFFIISLIIISIISCKEEEGPEGLTSLISMSGEPVGTNCSNGGQRIDTGIDKNRNGLLDANEIQASSFLCNGDDGRNSITKSFPEPAGDNCTAGGIKITSGIDMNSNNELEDSEIQRVEFICNGIDGAIDNQIRIKIGGFVYSNDPNPVVSASELVLFSKSFYPQIDSAIFVVFDIKTTDYHSVDLVGQGTFQLFDITHDKVIENSTILSDDIPANSYVKSANLIDNLPNEVADYGIRLFSGGNYNVSCGYVYLILYRRLK